MKTVLSFLLLAALVLAQKPEELAGLEGKLVDSATGEPVRRASLVLRPASQTRTFTTVSDSQGRFSMKDLPPGSYRLSASRNGYVSGDFGAKRAAGTATPITLIAGQKKTGIEFKLTPHGVIAGRLMDEFGEPVARATVSAIRYGYSQGRKQAISVGSSSTNDLGEYRIFGLAPGKYFVVARDVSTLSGSSGPASEDRSTTPQPVEGYVPTFYPGSMDASSAVQVNVVAGLQMQGTNITLARSRLVSVRGRLVNQTGNAGARLSIAMLPKEPMGYPNMMSPTVDTQGRFEIRNLVPGEYAISSSAMLASASGQLPSYLAVTSQLVRVGSEDMDNVTVVLSPGIDLAGTVTGPAIMVNSRVALRVAEPVGLSMGGGPPSAAIGEDGTFTLKGVGTDRMIVSVTNLPPGSYVKSMRLGDEDVLENPLEAGRGGKLSIVIAAGAGQISGRAGEGGGVTVVAIPDSEKRRGRQDFYRSTVTDSSGNFVLTPVDPGSYRLYAFDDVETGAWLDPVFMDPLRSKGKAVTVAEGGKETAELSVILE